jgi:ABC-type lipoprotein release transport system permease subunit
MGTALAIAFSGVDQVLRNPLRSAVTVACVVAVLVPWIAFLGVSRGLLAEAEVAIEAGADLTVTGERFGRDAPLPLSAVERIRAVPGVTDAVPRIVGEIVLGRDRVRAVLVGVPADRLPATVEVLEGHAFAAGAGHQWLVGRQLARRLALEVGSKIPPFYANDEGERLSTVVGLFRADVGAWESNVVLTSLESAAAIFAQKELVTEVLVWCAPAYRDDVRRGLLALPPLDGGPHGPLRPRVVSRADARALVPQAILHREGVGGLLFLLAFAVGIPLVLVTSGIGLSERRREVGLLKACGWQTDELLLRAGAESLLLAVASAALALLLAWTWLGPLRAVGLASVLLDGADAVPAFDVPYRLTPVPALLAALVALAVVLTGTLFSTWRTASAPPYEAMR